MQISGWGVPLRTLIPIIEGARLTRLTGSTLPWATSDPSPESARMTMSKLSRRAKRLGMASGTVPTDAPRAVTPVWPVACSYSGIHGSTNAYQFVALKPGKVSTTVGMLGR